MSAFKKYPEQTIIGEEGVSLINRRVLDLGWIWNPIRVEAGIDGIIEIRDHTNSRATNWILQVQSRATRGSFQAETAERFEYVCDERELDYWLSGNAPVLLVISRPATQEAYWVALKDYFREPAARNSRRVTFDKKKDRFDVTARDRLLALALPPERGIYLAPPPVRESLKSNLLAISAFPGTLSIASTDCVSGGQVAAALPRSCRDSWLFRGPSSGRQIVAFGELSGSAWDELLDRGTLESFDSTEWALSDDAQRVADFIELLKYSLIHKLRPHGIAYSQSGEYFYFSATRDRRSRRIPYHSLQKATERNVFQPFLRPESGDVKYYRHSAFSAEFTRIESSWYLGITPTYHFTSDGQLRHPFYETKLKGIKALERNPAVLGQVVMWAALLRGTTPLYADTDGMNELRFGDLAEVTVEAGIDDVSWLSTEEDKATKDATGDLSDLRLPFDGTSSLPADSTEGSDR